MTDFRCSWREDFLQWPLRNRDSPVSGLNWIWWKPSGQIYEGCMCVHCRHVSLNFALICAEKMCFLERFFTPEPEEREREREREERERER